MVFGRLKKNRDRRLDAPADIAETGGQAQETPTGLRAAGPFDVSEKRTETGYVDLGALRLAAAEGLQLRLEVEERTKRVIAVTLDLEGSSLQLQAFAAPRSEGIWEEIRAQIKASVESQGGKVQEQDGVFGVELTARLPAQTPDGKSGFRVARFAGIDGPRWFLRGVFGGPAAMDPSAAGPLEGLFRNTVVVRGDQPLPPRELLPLRLPADAADAAVGGGGGNAGKAAPGAQADPLKRGPEITHIG
jgi:hypothetical protein